MKPPARATHVSNTNNWKSSYMIGMDTVTMITRPTAERNTGRRAEHNKNREKTSGTQGERTSCATATWKSKSERMFGGLHQIRHVL